MNTKEYILEKITNAIIDNDPWDHVVIKNFLPESFYNDIVKISNIKACIILRRGKCIDY